MTTQTTTQTSDDIEAPQVLLTACLRFVSNPTEPGVCAECGWLEDDHVSTRNRRAAA